MEMAHTGGNGGRWLMVVVGVPLFSVAAGAALSGGHWAVATAALLLLAGLLGLGIMLLVTRLRSN